MQHNDRNYFVEFAGFGSRGSTINCSQVARHANSKSSIYYAPLDKVYTRGNCSGFVMNSERFSTGLVLRLHTRRRMKTSRFGHVPGDFESEI